MTSDPSGPHPAIPTASDAAARKKGIPMTAMLAALSAATFLCGAAGLTIATAQDGSPATLPDLPAPRIQEPIIPLPQSIELDGRKVLLGRRLFTDSRLSSGNGLSCASCHQPALGMADGKPVSSGLPHYEGVVNTLTVLNVGFNTKFSWSGQTLSLEEQADKVIENKRTMGGRWETVLSDLSADSGLTTAFGRIYADGLTRKNVVDAIAEYEKSLVTPNAPFDRFLRGETDAIGEDAKAGYRIFKDYGCISCHQGVNVGGNMLQVFGIFGTPTSATDGANTAGAAQGSGIADDKPVFRVPSLRNVAQTAPYFHDGSARSLREAISMMAQYQLGREISDGDVSKIESFLDSLSGDPPLPPVN
ncbi:cytochrome-c peroxidase [Rhizobium puerariae]|uniref:Cytochrome-c peroxidase n=1 Tax=Rhizobium puerariae TaxID=1585791 RepID=A0ABV6AMN7_9HYPH